MTSFLLLSPNVRSLFSLWAVFLCVGFTISSVYALSHRQKRNAAISFGLLLLPYFVFQVCAQISYYYIFGRISKSAENIAGLPYVLYIIALCILTGLVALCLYMNRRYNEYHITPKSVKQAADNLPTGFVYYLPSGQIYMSNHKMNSLDVELFNHPLLNGAEFAKRIADKKIFETKDGTVYRFTQNMLNVKGDTMCEIIAEDITEIYRKNETLSRDNEALRAHNKRMRQYGEQIGETVKQEEILKAKAHIHDEMNKILLTIGNAIEGNIPEERKNVLNELQTNVFLLCMNAKLREEDPLEDLYKIAESIGITIHLNEKPKAKGKTLLTFILGAQECMINAVKHAEAKNFYIEINETDEMLECIFTNDGRVPESKPIESGGLANLRRRIEKQGGTMTIESNPEFIFNAKIPKEEKIDEM